MTNVDTEFQKFEGTLDAGEQAIIFYLLKARIASGLENQESGSENITDSMGKVWTDAAANVDKLVDANPGKALELGLTLCLLPHDPDPKKEDVYQWMRGDGPIILAKEGLQKPLRQYLESNPQAPVFAAKIQEYMSFDIGQLTSEQVFSEPRCFLAVASMYLGTKLEGLRGNPHADDLYQSATNKLADPHIVRVVEIYRDIEDVAWIVDELQPFMP